MRTPRATGTAPPAETQNAARPSGPGSYRVPPPSSVRSTTWAPRVRAATSWMVLSGASLELPAPNGRNSWFALPWGLRRRSKPGTCVIHTSARTGQLSQVAERRRRPAAAASGGRQRPGTAPNPTTGVLAGLCPTLLLGLVLRTHPNEPVPTTRNDHGEPRRPRGTLLPVGSRGGRPVSCRGSCRGDLPGGRPVPIPPRSVGLLGRLALDGEGLAEHRGHVLACIQHEERRPLGCAAP